MRLEATKQGAVRRGVQGDPPSPHPTASTLPSGEKARLAASRSEPTGKILLTSVFFSASRAAARGRLPHRAARLPSGEAATQTPALADRASCRRLVRFDVPPQHPFPCDRNHGFRVRQEGRGGRRNPWPGASSSRTRSPVVASQSRTWLPQVATSRRSGEKAIPPSRASGLSSRHSSLPEAASHSTTSSPTLAASTRRSGDGAAQPSRAGAFRGGVPCPTPRPTTAPYRLCRRTGLFYRPASSRRTPRRRPGGSEPCPCGPRRRRAGGRRNNRFRLVGPAVARIASAATRRGGGGDPTATGRHAAVPRAGAIDSAYPSGRRESRKMAAEAGVQKPLVNLLTADGSFASGDGSSYFIPFSPTRRGPSRWDRRLSTEGSIRSADRRVVPIPLREAPLPIPRGYCQMSISTRCPNCDASYNLAEASALVKGPLPQMLRDLRRRRGQGASDHEGHQGSPRRPADSARVPSPNAAKDQAVRRPPRPRAGPR